MSDVEFLTGTPKRLDEPCLVCSQQTMVEFDLITAVDDVPGSAVTVHFCTECDTDG